MKKTVFFAILVLISCLLFSCVEESVSLFEYQERINRVTGEYTENGTVRKITLYFKRSEEKTACRRVEYASPESLRGMSFTLEGERITAEYNGMRIENTCFSAEDVFFASRLFDLREEDVLEIKKGDGETTVAKGKTGDGTWEAVTDKNGSPISLAMEGEWGSCSFSVEEIIFEETE